MSLTTNFGITVPFNPEIVFMAARRIIGIPGEHPFEILDKLCGDTPILSTPADFGAMLIVWHHDGLPVVLDDDAPVIYVRVSLDTSYQSDIDPFELHRQILTELGAWCDSFGLEWWTHGEQQDGWARGEAPYARAKTN
jgi:hypothetical protein